jgi:hypothetical protein
VTVFSVDESVVENYSYGSLQITAGDVQFQHADDPLSIAIVRDADKGQASAHIALQGKESTMPLSAS